MGNILSLHSLTHIDNMIKNIVNNPPKLKDEKIKLDSMTKKLFANNKLMLSHDVKFLADLYLNIGRTTLSLGGSALLEFARNKFEFSYPGQQMATPQQNTNPQLMGMQQQKRGLFK
jgi:hypothetical protein